ncbi:ABC transporter permease [Staphylococcus caeli]|uniref:ABC transporter permease n=1 Tax=Staphylococcus caeli TaxID=2201815 RepID=UPI003F56540F
MKKKLHLNFKKLFMYCVIAIIAWFIISFLIIPNVRNIIMTMFKNGSFSLDAFHKIMQSGRALESIKNSFILAFCLSISANIIGIFLVLLIDYFKIKGSRLLFLGYASTLIFGGIILANGYQYVYGKTGIITNLLLKINPDLNLAWFEGFFGVLFTMTFATTSLHMLLLRSAFKHIDFNTVQAAQNLGASHFTIIRKIIIPALKPYLITLTILLFQQGLGAMSAPLILGGRDFQTIAPMILNFTNNPNSRDLAALLSLILGLAQLILLSLALYMERKSPILTGSKVKTKFKKIKIRNTFGNIVIHIIAWILFIIYVLPLLLVCLFTFLPTENITSGKIALNAFTLSNYSEVFGNIDAFKPFLTSIVYAGLASLIVVVFMIFISHIITKYKNVWTNILEIVLYIPWMLPSILFALGLILTYSTKQFWIGNQILIGTTSLMLIAYIIIKIPFTLRITKSSFSGVDPNLENAAKNLGASTLYTFRKIVFPVILPVALAVFALNFNDLLQDFEVSLFLYHPFYEPLGVTIYNTSNSPQTPNAPAISMVYSVSLMLINAVVYYVVYGKAKNISNI